MAAFTKLQQLEPDLYQASFDISLTVVNVFVIADPEDGFIVIDTGAPKIEGVENPVVQVVSYLCKKQQDAARFCQVNRTPCET